MIDELNITSGQPAAEPPLDANTAESESVAAAPLANGLPAGGVPADDPAAETADLAAQSPASEPTANPAETHDSPAIEPIVPAMPAVAAESPSAAGEAKPEEAKPDQEAKSDKMDWYILKVQSNREESIREGLLRRIAIAGLDRYFDEVIVPTEKVTEFKGGKKRVVKRKLYPGYLVVHMEINDDTWFLVRETPGIGDFTGAAGHPSPMLPHEVSRMVAKQEEKSEKRPS